jgi:predicted nucleic acid-binding protein
VSLVVDASTALASVLPDEGSKYARSAIAAALNEGLVVPALWPYEIQNGLVMAVRRERIDRERAFDALDALRALRAKLQQVQSLGQEYRLAQAHSLTSHDAAYLLVALGTGARLATGDKRLRNIATKIGIECFTAR